MRGPRAGNRGPGCFGLVGYDVLLVFFVRLLGFKIFGYPVRSKELLTSCSYSLIIMKRYFA